MPSARMLSLKVNLAAIFFWVYLSHIPYLSFGQQAIDLKPSWMQFNTSSGEYAPFDSTSDQNIAHFHLNAQIYEGYTFEVISQSNFTVYFDHRLVYQGCLGQTKVNKMRWPIDSLAKQFQNNVLVSIHGSASIEKCVLSSNIEAYNTIGQNEIIAPIEKDTEAFENYILFSLILAFVLLVVFKLSFPKAYQDCFNISAALRMKPREDIFYDARLLEPQSLLLYLFYASLATYIIFYQITLFDLMDINTFSDRAFILAMLAILIILFGLNTIKFLWISLFSAIYDFRGFAKVQFYDDLRLGLLITFIVIAFSQVNILFAFIHFDLEAVKLLVISLLLLKTAVLLLKLIRLINVKRIYLFSYICTTELVPLFFVIKFINSAS